MDRRVIQTPGAPEAIGPYSQAIVCDGWLFASGQIPLDPATGQLVEGSIEQQAECVFRNLAAVLQDAGTDFSEVVKTTVYLTNLADFPRFNDAYARYFASAPPARATVQVSALPRGAAVEVELVARVPKVLRPGKRARGKRSKDRR